MINLYEELYSSPHILASPSDDLSERRSSNSSLTSVTSRGSIMSPPEFNGASGGSSAANLTSKMFSLKGKLSGAFSYWTGKEKSPTQEKPCMLSFSFSSLLFIYFIIIFLSSE